MKLGFEESQTAYTSGSQNACAWTEAWVQRMGILPALRQRDDFLLSQ
jgi:type II restriction enzyme